MRLLLAIFFSAIATLAQQNVTIKGVVVDAQTGAPVAGATVELRYSTSRAAVDTAETAAPGAFELAAKDAGKYLIAVYSPGYRESVSEPTTVTEAEFEPGASAVNRKIELKVPRSGGITGFLRDAETRDAVRRIPVRALRLWWRHGYRVVDEISLVLSDDEGIFRFDSLPPGDDAIMLGNTTAFSAPEKKVYPVMLWEQSATTPVIVKDGIQTELGAIDYRKIVAPRFIAPECEEPYPGAQMEVRQNVAGGWFPLGPRSVSSCGAMAAMPVVSRGQYRVNWVIRSGEPLGGYEDVVVRDGEDTKLRLQSHHFITLSGRVSCECEKAPDFEKPVRIHLMSSDEILNATSFTASRVGPFSLALPPAGEMRIGVSDLPPDLSVKRLLWNGTDASSFVSVNADSSATLEIVLSDKPAVLTGTVAGDVKTVEQVHVVAVKWPIPLGVVWPDFKSVEVNRDGQFTISGLAPGKYRAAAVGPEQWQRSDMPGVVAGWFASSDDITLAENETRPIRLEAKIP